jgi:uncharacterized protein (UPF0332 family)
VHAELLRTARKLVDCEKSAQPSICDLRRSVSTAYYALFHFVAQSCVETLLQDAGKALTRARQQAYRSLDHRDITTACKMTRGQDYGSPKQIRDFASVFLRMNKFRERADYDSSTEGEFQINQVLALVGECETVICEFGDADIDDRRAFAVQVCLKSKARA